VFWLAKVRAANLAVVTLPLQGTSSRPPEVIRAPDGERRLVLCIACRAAAVAPRRTAQDGQMALRSPAVDALVWGRPPRRWRPWTSTLGSSTELPTGGILRRNRWRVGPSVARRGASFGKTGNAVGPMARLGSAPGEGSRRLVLVSDWYRPGRIIAEESARPSRDPFVPRPAALLRRLTGASFPNRRLSPPLSMQDPRRAHTSRGSRRCSSLGSRRGAAA
jgi:hypothetical protein